MSKHVVPSLSSVIARTLLATGIGVLVSCAANPTGGTDFVLMRESTELEKGKELHEEMLKENAVYQDANLVDYVNRVGQRLAAVSHRPELEYTFTIIDSPDINAFALPGGYVYINRGLMTFLNTEAQLAAVLGHEIGHITARHAVRQQTAGRASNVLTATASVASVLATGTNVLGETAGLFGGALISGYGREMELEADGLGAEYLQKAGYDPNAMVEVIGVLKNHEDFMKRTSTRGQAYHGVFATHPRNDTRLKEAVGAASAQAGAVTNIEQTEFRARTTGLVIGPTLQNMTGADARNRYYQRLLNYTLVLPEAWTREETPTTMTAAAPDAKATLKVEALRLQDNKEPRLFIRENLKIPDLKQSEQLSQFGLPGFTGIRPDTGERIAVLYYGPRAFVLTGKADDEATDNALLASIKSFRPIARNEGVFANPVTVDWIQADGNTTYAALASQSRLPQHPEETLRLMNGDYPSGEPQAGEWIKIAN
ncbi:MAG TPA: M48 family metalloprotease [Pseudomonadales bacterium]